MIRILYDELEGGAKSVYLDATEVRFCSQKDVTTEYPVTITKYQAWHQFTTIDDQEDAEELVFP